ILRPMLRVARLSVCAQRHATYALQLSSVISATNLSPKNSASRTVPPSLQGTSRFKRLASRFIVPAAGPHIGPRAAFDVEGNGLLHDATEIHCVVIADLDSDRIDEYGPDRIGEALAHLSRCLYLVAHNANGFDVPVLARLFNWKPQPSCVIVDT